MTLFKRGKMWWTGFYVDGRRFQHSTGTNNRRQAELIEQKLKKEANLASFNIVVQDPRLTFDELAEQFVAKNTLGRFHVGRLSYLSAFFGTMLVGAITKNTTLEYRQLRQTNDGPLKDATLNRDIAVLRRVFYWALEQGLIATNPLARVTMVRERRVKKPVLSIEHEDAILKVAKPHLKFLIVAASDTGMRRGELFQQRWEDVDLDRGVLFVTRSKTAEGDGREIPLTTRLLSMLKEAAARADRTTDFVFTFQGHPITDLKRSWGTAQRDAELSLRYRFHDLRHTFATRLMEAGVVQDIRMSLMGHEPRTVHWGYTHVELPAKREAIKKLEAWWGKLSKKTHQSRF
jgi:integrase